MEPEDLLKQIEAEMQKMMLEYRTDVEHYQEGEQHANNP